MITVDVNDYSTRGDQSDDNEHITVGELIDHLSNYPQTELVCATWEGVIAPIKTENFERE